MSIAPPPWAPDDALLFGRGRELNALIESYAAVAADRRPRAVVLRGPAGIGKTAIALAAVRHARKLGALSLIGRADEFDRGMPFGVLRDAIDRAELTRGAGDVLESLRRSLDLREGLDTNTPIERRMDRILGELIDLFRTVGADAPAVLVLEDLHDADPESLTLIGRLVRHVADLPVQLVISYRPGYPGTIGDLQRFFRRLAAGDRAQLIDVESLSVADTAALARRAAGRDIDDGEVARIRRYSGGNPFLVIQLAATVAGLGAPNDLSSGQLDRDDPPLAADTLRTLIDRFLSGDETELAVAGAISVFGRFDQRHQAVLTALVDLEPETVDGYVDQLVERRLLRRTGSTGYEFAHPLLRDALYRDLGDLHRNRMHRRAADLLREAGAAGAKVDAFELATHAYASRVGSAADVAACLDAADVAARSSPLVAAFWLERALEMMPATDPRRPEVYATRLFSLIVGNRIGEAVEVAQRVMAELAPDTIDANLVFAAVNALFAGDRLAEALAIADTRLRRAPDPALICSRVILLAQQGRASDAEIAYPDALAALVAGPPTDPIELAQSWNMLHSFATFTGRADDATHHEAQVRMALERLPAAPRSDQLHILATTTLQGRGGPIEAARTADTAGRLGADEVTYRALSTTRELLVLMVDWLRGNWEEVRAPASSIMPALEMSGPTTVMYAKRAITALVLWETGDTVGAQALAGDLMPGPSASCNYVALIRARLARPTDRQSAEMWLRRRIDEVIDRGEFGHYTMVTEELVDFLLEGGDPDGARRVAEDAAARVAPLGWPMLDLYAWRGLAAATGDREAATRAVELAEREGMPFELARAQVVLAQLTDDAAPLLDAAYRTFRDLGATVWQRRVAAELRDRGLPVPRLRRTTSDRLTETERQVARLVVAGLSNREVAEQLHYSTKTVEAYLSRVFTKTGLHGRVALTAGAWRGDVALESTDE
ncbi:helix-turn-helix transcriptional regulator [Gordonia sinesedis]